MHRRRRKEILVEKNAIRILDRHRTMAISTVRPDGWPQTTIAGYANDGLTLYFLIFRSGQKFANIDGDDRVSTPPKLPMPAGVRRRGSCLSSDIQT